MVLVHRHGTEARLEQRPVYRARALKKPRIALLGLAECPRQTVSVGRHEDDVHVIGHQAIGPAGDVGLAAALGQQVSVERIVVVREEHTLTAVDPRRDMVREARDNDTGGPGHGDRAIDQPIATSDFVMPKNFSLSIFD